MTKGGLFQGRLSSFEPDDRAVPMPEVSRIDFGIFAGYLRLRRPTRTKTSGLGSAISPQSAFF
tara:strand:- start:456 stop:644 length:189 start_codon:yes stop_codon:yes gene_type:complete